MRQLVCLLAIAQFTGIVLGQAGSIDLSFNATDQGNAFGDGPNSFVTCTAYQPDGKVIIGGAFNGHNTILQNAYYLARLDSTGVLDPTFNTATGANDQVYAIALQADGKAVVAGRFTNYKGGSVGRIVRVNADASTDASFSAGTGANGDVREVAVQGDGSMLIAGAFSTINGTPRSRIARLTSAGAIDVSFDPGSGADGIIDAMAVQPDGKILIGGSFASFNGVARNRIARLNSDGSLDASFDPGSGANSDVLAIVLQADGKILLGGAFSLYNGIARGRIARLSPAGANDATFAIGTGCSSNVEALAVQPDGSILASGHFTSYNGTARNRVVRVLASGALDPQFTAGSGADQAPVALTRLADGRFLVAGYLNNYDNIYRRSIARILANGTLDQSFNRGSGANHWVSTTSLQPDGKIFIGGYFTMFNGTSRKYFTRLLPDGQIDQAFNASASTNDWVTGSVVQPDGRILIAGEFTVCNGMLRRKLARLNSDGSLDPGFNPGTGPSAGGVVIALQPDGRIIVAGYFTSFNGTPANRMIRLMPNGAVDPTFSVGPGPNADVTRICIQPDGRILIGGSFSSVGGTARNRLARLNADGSLDASFDPGSGADNTINDVRLLPDGRWLVGGSFDTYNGTAKPALVRLEANGALDNSFVTNMSANGNVQRMLPLPDGKILMSGSIAYNSDGNLYVMARLNASGSTDGTFSVGPGSIGMTLADMVCQTDGKVIIAGFFVNYAGTGRNRIARINNATPATLLVRVRAALEGPIDPGTLIMSDALRAGNLLPLTEPYTALGYAHQGGGGGETTFPAILAVTGNNAIVDWVVVEIRDQANHTWMSRSALLQRDGDVVRADGSAWVTFSTIPGNYHVAVRHRNHFGAMTASTASLSAVESIHDFTSSSLTAYGNSARNNVSGTMVLWPGDALPDGTIRYVGNNNDRDPILVAIGGSTPTNVVSGVYSPMDVNMDGSIKYVGANNDRDPILTTVGGSTPTNTRTAQLP